MSCDRLSPSFDADAKSFVVHLNEGGMLVLTRGAKQRIEIGHHFVTVTVLDVKGGRVRLGIEAPADVTIRRRGIPDENRAVFVERRGL